MAKHFKAKSRNASLGIGYAHSAKLLWIVSSLRQEKQKKMIKLHKKNFTWLALLSISNVYILHTNAYVIMQYISHQENKSASHS